ncbi:MAG: rhamnan synthesis F family protein [Microbacterium sp.]
MPDQPGADRVVRLHVVYAVASPGSGVPSDTAHALSAVRAIGAEVTIVHRADAAASALAGFAARLVQAPGDDFSTAWYLAALAGVELAEDDELVLTGDACIGPVGSLDALRAGGRPWDVWSLVENLNGQRESFPAQGFPALARPWMWSSFRGAVVRSGDLAWYLEQATRGDVAAAEYRVVSALRARGWSGGHVYPAADFPSNDPALLNVPLLLAAGCPFVDKAVFQSYPPFLDRLATIGREVVQEIGDRGYPLPALWDGLARATPPKALNTNAGMLEVLADDTVDYDPARPFRLAVIARVTWLGGLDELLARIARLPGPVDLFVTTTEGTSAAKIERALEKWSNGRGGRCDVRVTPASGGRDMADFFVACRDVLLSDAYDLVVKLHARKARRKTVNHARYFRRYQLENLLSSEAYARNLLALFQHEPGLGVVFPPTMHIGYAIMGHGWAGLRERADEVCASLGITVPLDEVSPLAPYGGMWVARPAALRLLAEQPWSFGDYSRRREKKYGHLAHLQERLVVPAAAQRGFHSRTVLNAEHAAISHTALEFKADELFSTTRGYPVEQIQLLHRAGFTGHGGPVALARMYVRVNHPRLAARLRPLYRLAFRTFGVLAVVRRYVGARAGRLDKESM